MRTSTFSIALAAFVGVVAATPIESVAERRASLAARQYPSFPGFGNSNNYYGYNGYADVSTGNSGDANGGNVNQDAGATGTISNGGASGKFVVQSQSSHVNLFAQLLVVLVVIPPLARHTAPAMAAAPSAATLATLTAVMLQTRVVPSRTQALLA